MQTRIFRVTIINTASAISKVEEFNGTWTETKESVAGDYFLPFENVSVARVITPATMQGVNVQFKDSYAYNVASVVSRDENGSLIVAGGIVVASTFTLPAELSTMALVEPFLADSSNVAQAQSQETILVFVLKSATGPNK